MRRWLLPPAVAVLTILTGTPPQHRQGRFVYKELDPGHGKVAIADLNRDGRNDVILRGSGEEALTWFEALAPGGYRKHVVLRNLRFSGDRIAVADIDGDGDLDIVTGLRKEGAGGDAPQLVWLRNPLPAGDPGKSGAWSVQIIGHHDGYIKNFAIADFDRDGLPDVVTRAHEQTAIYFQKPGGGWSREVLLRHESHEGMDVADLDCDGDPDIILNGFWFESPPDALKGEYKRHNFDRKWSTPVEDSWRDNNSTIKVADFNGDAIPDILIAHSELPGYPISLYIASSVRDVKNDRWREVRVAGQFDFCQTLEAGDIDNDGDLDVIAAKFERDHKNPQWRNQPPYPIVVFYNVRGDGLEWSAETISEEGMYAGVLGDVGSDGDLDIAGPRTYWDGPLKLWENQASQRKLALDRWHYIQVDDSRTRYGGRPQGDGGWFGLAMGDLTGDGYMDIVSGKWFYRNPGGDMTGRWERITVAPGIDNLLIVDVDGDERGDIIGARCNQQFWLEATDRQGSRWIATQIAALPVCDHGTSSQGYNLAQVVPGGKPEILLTGNGIYYLEIPDHPEEVPWRATTVTPGGNSGEWVSAADMDGDGDLDVLAGAQGKGEAVGVAWWENPGDGSSNWKRHLVGRTQFHLDKIIGADVNGNGRVDLVVTEERYPGPDPDASMYWFEAPADPRQPDWKRHTIVTQYSMNNLDVADLDRDGDPDIVTGEHKGPHMRVQIWENVGGGKFVLHEIDRGKESHLGTRLADLDGDGDLDLVSQAWNDFQYLHVWRNEALAGGCPSTGRRVSTAFQRYGTEQPAILPQYRLPIEVRAGNFERTNKVVEIDVNFTEQLESVGSRQPFAVESLRLVEVDARGAIIDPAVVFQFDRHDRFDATNRAEGTLVFLLGGKLAAQGVRRYQLYFGEALRQHTPPKFPSLIQVEDIGSYEGDATFRINTPSATYYYHKNGSGFASMVDREGRDWISYHPEGGPKGNYRGIPNLAPAGFHPGPGKGNKESRLVIAGPVRVRILSETKDERWAMIWDVYPGYATMTLLKKGEQPYWILYEGTPGGEFNLTDYWVDSSGRRFEMPPFEGHEKAWHGDLPDPEWVYFGDAKLDRVLFLALHEKEKAIDEFWHFGEQGMTVFGFGRGPKREGWQRLEKVPAQFTIGFAESARFAEAAKAINSAYRPVSFVVGPPERIE